MLRNHLLKLLSALEGLGQGGLVGIFQVGAEGKPPGEAGHSDPQGGNQPVEVHRGRLPLQTGVGGQDDLLHYATLEPREKLLDLEVIGADAIHGGDHPVEHMI